VIVRKSTRGMLGLMAVAVCMVIALPLVACGGEEQEPAETPAATATAETPAADDGPMDVVDTIVADGRFTQLATGLQNAGLIRTGFGLKGEGPMTVFAPTDDAFAQIPAEQLDALLADPTGAMMQVLTYHVVEDEVLSGGITDGMTVVTAQGEELAFTVADGKVMVDGAEIVEADIEASNGVVHVIDAVMVPPSLVAQE